ncbi:MAG: phosphate signaling complex protein PhoU [Bacteroidota bacterium]|nr:phosphate signaling complex protein PhoU [Bacteroidota bacterium]
MTHLESEINKIRQAALEMMNMVRNQMRKCKEALMTGNKELALDVMHQEKRVNGYELMIDNDCENLIACFSPVAIDLRFVLATLKINYHLERIGDNADGMARNVLDLEDAWSEELLMQLQLVEVFDMVDEMMNDVITSFENEDSSQARSVFEKDKQIDLITDNALKIIAEYIRKDQDNVEKNLLLLLIHRKLERIGDLMKNISEEIIFFLEAKVLKHLSKN